MPAYLGIDPGASTGAYGWISDDFAHVDDLPVVAGNVDAAAFHRALKVIKPTIAIIEKVSVMPGQGIASGFKFGKSVGLVMGVLACHGISIIEVTPAKWKGYFHLGKDKEKSRALAVRLFPQLQGLDHKKDHGRAEALLIARWYMENYCL